VVEKVTQPGQPWLAVTGLTKSYRDLKALDHVSFSINKGEVFGLLGPNGAGKTTTIRILCGLLKADAGEISLNGSSLIKNYDREQACQSIVRGYAEEAQYRHGTGT